MMSMKKFGHSVVRSLQSRAFSSRVSRQIPVAQVPANSTSFGGNGNAVLVFIFFVVPPVVIATHYGIDYMAYRSAVKDLKARGKILER